MLKRQVALKKKNQKATTTSRGKIDSLTGMVEQTFVKELSNIIIEKINWCIFIYSSK